MKPQKMPICKQLTRDCVRSLGGPGVLPVRGWIFSTPFGVFFPSFFRGGLGFHSWSLCLVFFAWTSPAVTLSHWTTSRHHHSGSPGAVRWIGHLIMVISPAGERLIAVGLSWLVHCGNATVGWGRSYCVLWRPAMVLIDHVMVGFAFTVVFLFLFSETHMTKWTFWNLLDPKICLVLFFFLLFPSAVLRERSDVCRDCFPSMQFL